MISKEKPSKPIPRIKKDIHGIVLLNKPTGMSSNRALQKVKHILQAKKAGHTGALDPLATGLLPLCFGQATKLAEYLLGQDKTYVVHAKLGQRTTTSDSEGEVCLERPVPTITNAQFEKVLDDFRGDIQQTPSMYSALKHQGKPLYHYARQGITIDRPARPITIYQCDLLHLDQDSFSLRVRCSKGTYIRTLVDDIGEVLGCGAHVTALHREAIAGVKGDMIPLDEVVSLADPMQALSMPDAVVPCDIKILDATSLKAFQIGTLSKVDSDSTTKYLCLKDEDHIIYGYAELSSTGHYNITKRFIHGFGHSE